MDEPEIKIIDVFVCKIRKKLRAVDGHDVETVWGRGYVLRDEAKPFAASPSLAPEMRDMIEQPPVHVSGRTVKEAEALRARQRFGAVASPSIVPGQGQR
jgi:hypothetical protein